MFRVFVCGLAPRSSGISLVIGGILNTRIPAKQITLHPYGHVRLKLWMGSFCSLSASFLPRFARWNTSDEYYTYPPILQRTEPFRKFRNFFSSHFQLLTSHFFLLINTFPPSNYLGAIRKAGKRNVGCGRVQRRPTNFRRFTVGLRRPRFAWCPDGARRPHPAFRMASYNPGPPIWLLLRRTAEKTDLKHYVCPCVASQVMASKAQTTRQETLAVEKVRSDPGSTVLALPRTGT